MLARYLVFTVMKIQFMIFWVVTPCSEADTSVLVDRTASIVGGTCHITSQRHNTEVDDLKQFDLFHWNILS
jgi:hypothetical protein